MTAAIDLVRRIESTPWSWDVDAWKAAGNRLGLKLLKSASDRLEFSDADDVSWTAYTDGDRIENFEITYDACEETHLISDEKFEELIEKYEASFHKTVGAMSTILGDPEIFDGEESEDFPEAGECLYLATWQGNGKQVMLAMKSEDREVPIRLCLIVVPESDQ